MADSGESVPDTSEAVSKVESAQGGGDISESGAKNLYIWLTKPHYGKYVPRLLELIDAGDFKYLDELFWEVIPFGTGGRRGPMGELGCATINERTIAESAHGMATYFKQYQAENGDGVSSGDDFAGRAVVTCDTRNRSDEFARLTATTFAANGFKVFFFDGCRATPELSFAVRHLECSVGAMISASHNPPSDNGFKAYWSHGGQVLPPHDQGIIDAVYAAGEIPTVDFDEAVADGRIVIIGEKVDRAYLDAVASLSLSDKRDMPALFTPLHGVGETAVYRVLEKAGFTGVEIFEPQRKPDGDFTNVPDQLPNPERTEVFQPALEYAKRSGAELVLASDPDADRLGVCAKNASGEFEHFTGNQIGVLLADYILDHRIRAGTLSSEHYVVTTLVTTPMIAEVARAHRVRCIDDLLVGFKYIGQTIDKEGPERFAFGTEESLGYLAGTYARDKCAAIAGLYVMELAAELRVPGHTLRDRLDELYEQHGYFAETQDSVVCTGPSGKEQFARIMARLRDEPPTELGPTTLDRVRDYKRHENRSLRMEDDVTELPEPEGDLLIFETGANLPLAGTGEVDSAIQMQIAARPSGTEPKIKFYFFAQSGRLAAGSLDEARQRTDQTMQAAMNALSKWVDDVLDEP